MTLRLTMAQALVRYLAAQRTECEGRVEPLFAGVWAIFGHGNVAGTRRGAVAARAISCRPTARTTSRRWRMRRSPSPRRRGGGA